MPGMSAVAVMTALCFSGFGVLFATVPLWAVRSGADPAGAGVVNGVLMLLTVLTQTVIPWALRRLGWAAVLTIGLLALGVPGPLYLISGDLGWLLLLSAVRGVGFGVITVCGSAAIAELTPPLMRGRAVGAYGLAISAPQILTMTGAPWLAEKAGFAIVFVLGALPVVAIPAALLLARRLREADAGAQGGDAEESAVSVSRGRVLLMLVVPVVVLTLATSSGGALLTFMPQMVQHAALSLAGLFVLLTVAAVARWWIGGLVDKRGSKGLAWPLLLCAGGGLVLVATVLPWHGVTTGVVALVIAGAALVGVAYGGLQSLTLVQAFERAGQANSRLASAVWNIGFDSGTGLGSTVVGALATWYSYPAALVVIAVVCGLAAVGTLAPGRRSG